MAVPTLAASVNSAWNTTTTPKTASVTTAVGDILAVLAAGENDVFNAIAFTLNLPTGGTPTYANAVNLRPASYCCLRIDTASAGVTAQSYTLSQDVTNPGLSWGTATLRFSGSDGIGASASTNATTGGPSLSITTTQDNSAICVIVGDWNASDGATRTWRTVNGITPTAGNGAEINYFRDATTYATYAAYYSDAGSAGAKTVGLSAPTGMKYTIAAVEIKGSAAAPPRVQVVGPSLAVIQASTW